MSDPRFIIKDGEYGPEYWEGDDRLAFINEQGTLQSTRGNADRKPDIAAFIDWHAAHDKPMTATEAAENWKKAPKDHSVEVTEKVGHGNILENVKPLVMVIAEPGFEEEAAFEALEQKEGKTPEEKAVLDSLTSPAAAPVKDKEKPKDPPVPEIKPLQSGGRGKFDPPFFWWAWNQPTAYFLNTYGVTQAEFSKGEHAGYVDKVKRVLTQSH